MLTLSRDAWLQMIGHVYDGLPDEACGLFAGDPATGNVRVFYPCRNEAESSRIYRVDSRDHFKAIRAAEDEGLELLGVIHSHTHTDAYPSPTDVEAAAAYPEWHYIIVSLRHGEPVLRSYRIVEGTISEEPVGLA